MEKRTWLDVVNDALEDLSIYAPSQYTEQVEEAQAVVQYVLLNMLPLSCLLAQSADTTLEEAA